MRLPAARLAMQVERRTCNPEVARSNPAPRIIVSHFSNEESVLCSSYFNCSPSFSSSC